MSDSQLDLRRRRALYRATHRGSKELDFLLGRYAAETIPDMASDDLAVMEHLIEAPDPLLAECIYEGTRLGEPGLDELIGRMRRYHASRTPPRKTKRTSEANRLHRGERSISSIHPGSGAPFRQAGDCRGRSGRRRRHAAGPARARCRKGGAVTPACGARCPADDDA
nr:succinate dehydrogenase assembly factor 2 [Methyloligella halotolerans]